jgi:hypothetical protein
VNQVAIPGIDGPSLRPLRRGRIAGTFSDAAVRWTILAGVAVGVTYALSPLTVIVSLVFVPLCWWAVRDLTPLERRAVLAMLVVAMALRIAAVVVLLLSADPNAGSFAKFFGDEEFFQLRGFWLYNVWMGIPISQEAFLYAYNGIGYSGYEPFLVFVQILVGPAPYGIHLLNSLIFIGACVLLYRAARRSYGSAPALVGLAVVLFLPSLFSWSVSALKESFFVGLTVVVVLAAAQVVRERSLAARILAVIVVIIGLRMIESVRPGGLMLTAGGLALGFAICVVTFRRSTKMIAAVAAVLAVVYVWHFGLPAPTEATLERFARYSRGHVFTPGHSYKLLDEVFYADFFGSHGKVSMSSDEMGRYVVRAMANYVSQPTPWNITSKTELFFMPEQLAWYLLLLLFPIGAVFAFRRDALLTCLLTGYSITNAAVLALNSGNVGTLVRHRALVVPFVVWIGAVGLVQLLTGKAATDASH